MLPSTSQRKTSPYHLTARQNHHLHPPGQEMMRRRRLQALQVEDGLHEECRLFLFA